MERGTWNRPVARTVAPIAAVFLIVVLVASMASAADPGRKGPVKKADPMIKITSLPIKQNLKEVMAKISEDVSKDTGLDKNFVTYYWQSFDGIYCPGCEKANLKNVIFVDMYVPAFMTTEEIQKTMTSLAAALARHTDYTLKEVYIHTHIGAKNQLFINGDLVRNWSQVGGPDDAKAAEQERRTK
jgi:hypothetical protein